MTRIWTIGHSTRSLDDLVAALTSFGIRVLVDIRRYPTSKRHPHFSTDPLRRGLHPAGIRYEYLGDELGGHREATPDVHHSALRGSAFLGYAQWMDRPMFREGVERLLRFAAEAPTAYMCAEGQYKSCHRKLLSDHLAILRGAEVVHILGPDVSERHPPTPGVRRVDDRLVYEVATSAKPLESFGDPS